MIVQHWFTPAKDLFQILTWSLLWFGDDLANSNEMAPCMTVSLELATPLSPRRSEKFLQGLNLAGALFSHILGKANQSLASDFQKSFKYQRAVLEVIWTENLVLIFPLMLMSISITVTGTALIFSDTSVDCGHCRRMASGSNSVSCAKCSTFHYGSILLLMYDVFQARRNYWLFSHLSSSLSMFAGHPLNKWMALTFTADVRIDNVAEEKRWGKCC